MRRNQAVGSQPSDDNQNQRRQSMNQQILKSTKKKQKIKKWKTQQSLAVKFNAIIRSGYFPQFQSLSVFYTIKNGNQWKKIQGQTVGISQMSSSPEGKIIWNFPIQVIYETDSIIEPPQIVFVMYGHDFFGRSIPKAYGNIHFPLSEGSQRRKVRMFTMNHNSFLNNVYSFFTGSYYQFTQIQKILCQNKEKQRANLRTKTSGQLQIQFQTKRFNFQKYGYNN